MQIQNQTIYTILTSSKGELKSGSFFVDLDSAKAMALAINQQYKDADIKVYVGKLTIVEELKNESH